MQPKNDAQVSVRLPGTAIEDLQAAADRRKRKRNWLLRDIVMKWLAAEKRRRGK